MSFDKSKFVVREGDAEGFTPTVIAAAMPPRYASDMFAARIETHGTTVTLQHGDSDWLLRHEALHSLFAGQRERGDALRAANPKGWQEADGVQLPPITWADYSDDELEYQFQQWLRNSSAPEKLDAYRARLRQRINDMVEKAQQPVDIVTDLREVR